MVSGGKAAGRLAIDGDQVRIAAKHGNVVLDPLQTQDLVSDTRIARDILGGQGQEAKRTQSVPDGDHDDVMREVEQGSIQSAGSVSARVSSAMDPEENRKQFISFRLRNINV